MAGDRRGSGRRKEGEWQGIGDGGSSRRRTVGLAEVLEIRTTFSKPFFPALAPQIMFVVIVLSCSL